MDREPFSRRIQTPSLTEVARAISTRFPLFLLCKALTGIKRSVVPIELHSLEALRQLVECALSCSLLKIRSYPLEWKCLATVPFDLIIARTADPFDKPIRFTTVRVGMVTTLLSLSPFVWEKEEV